MRIVMIVNPVAGASRRRKSLRNLLDSLRAAGMQASVRTTRGPNESPKVAAEAANEAEAIIAVGGDGTIREISDGLVGKPVPLIIWPTGTENLVAKSLGFRASAELLLACLQRGREVALDVGTANGRSFLVVAGVGFDAECVYRLAQTRSGHITHLSYAHPIWRTFWEHKFPTIRVIANDQSFWEGRGLVFVGNMARYSLGLPVVRDARPDDGLLDLLILPCRGRLKLIAHSLRTMIARHVDHGGGIYTRLKHLRIESSQPVPVELDGDQSGFLPLDVQVRPAALRVLLPPAEISPKPHWRWIGSFAAQIARAGDRAR